MKKILLIILSVWIPAAASFAQKRPKEFDAVIISKNVRYKGFIENVSTGGITIDYYGQPKFIASDSISSIKIKRTKALRKSALYGSVAGLLGGTALYVHQNRQGNLNSLASPVVILGAAMVGAGTAAIINTATSVQHYRNLNEPGKFKSIHQQLFNYSAAYHTTKRKVIADDTTF